MKLRTKHEEDFWAVGNKPYPEKIYIDEKTGMHHIYNDIKEANTAAEKLREKLGVAVVFPIRIDVE